MAKINYHAGATTATSAAGPARVPARNSISDAQVSGPARGSVTSTSSYTLPASTTVKTNSAPTSIYTLPTSTIAQPVAAVSTASHTLPSRNGSQAAAQTSSAPTPSYAVPTRNGSQAVAQTSSAPTANYALPSRNGTQTIPQTASYAVPARNGSQAVAPTSSAPRTSYTLSSGTVSQPLAQASDTSTPTNRLSSGSVAQPVGQASGAPSAGYALPTRSVAQPLAQTNGTSTGNSFARVISSSAADYSSRANGVGQPIAQPSSSYPLVNGTSNIAQPASSYPLVNGTSNIAQSANQVNAATTTIGSGPTLLGGLALASSATRNPRVEYYSESKGRWIPAVFQGFNGEFGTYTLDVQPFARPGDVRLAPEAAVEYYSNTRAGWVPAKVESFNEEFGVYALDIQPYAKPEDVRLASFPEPLEAPCMESRAGLSRRTKKVPTRTLDEPSAVPAAMIAPITSQVPVQQVAAQQMVAEEEDDPVLAKLVSSLSASDRFPVGAKVEYFMKGGTWLPATVMGFDETLGTYTLDIQPYALAGHIRLPGALECLPNVPGATGLVAQASEDDTPVAESGEGSGEAATPKAKGSIPQFTVQKQREGGRTVFVVFIEANDGSQVRAFDGDCTAFELGCEAEPMRMWLDGIGNDLLPGLLTLLQHEVSWRNDRLQEMQEEKDSFRGMDAYEFFGLTEDATEKEITRAYRDKAKELHPDKGGDEEEFADMRKRYEQLKDNRGGEGGKNSKAKGEGDPLSWDPCDRASMLNAHDRMRSFLVWVSNDALEIGRELEELRRRYTEASAARKTLLDDGQVAAEECPSTSAAPVSRGPGE